MEKQISPGLRTVFLIHFIVGGAFGLIYVFIPVVFGNLVNWDILEQTAYRLIGAATLGYAASSWLAYKAGTWEKVKIVVQIELIWTILGALVVLWGLLFASLPAFAWVNVFILGAFAVAFGILYSKQ